MLTNKSMCSFWPRSRRHTSRCILTHSSANAKKRFVVLDACSEILLTSQQGLPLKKFYRSNIKSKLEFSVEG